MQEKPTERRPVDWARFQAVVDLANTLPPRPIPEYLQGLRLGLGNFEPGDPKTELDKG